MTAESPAKPIVETVSFDAWFGSKVEAVPQLQYWQRNQLRVFMEGCGLSENEEKEKYDEAYLRF